MSVTKLLNYNLLHELGQGGMASVWYAENSVGRPFAIKLLKPELVIHEPSVAERFRNEAQIMVKLDHPAIRRVEDYYEDGATLAIIMEYLEGQDLHQLTRGKGKMPEDKVLKWLDPVLKALDYVHKKGYFHRDLKPANLFQTTGGQIKVMDFGIAKIVGKDMGLTQTSSMMGSPLYMSPEQILSPKDVDYRTDIYSLGVTLYTLLTGTKPYDDQQLSSFSIQSEIVQHPLPRLPHVSGLVNDVIAKATQKKPADRFQSCAEFGLALKAASMGEEEMTQVGKSEKRVPPQPPKPIPVEEPVIRPVSKPEPPTPTPPPPVAPKPEPTPPPISPQPSRAVVTPSKGLNIKAIVGAILGVLIVGEIVYVAFFGGNKKRSSAKYETEQGVTEPIVSDAERKGIAKAILFYKKAQYDSSFAILRRYQASQAFLTNPEAVTDLGIIYYFGGSDTDAIKRDLQKAEEWLQKGAELQSPKAHYYLGLLADGVDFTQVFQAEGKSADAVEHYKKSAAGGDSFARVTLGELYLKGNKLVKQEDPCEIQRYLNQAALDPNNQTAELVYADFKKRRFCAE